MSQLSYDDAPAAGLPGMLADQGLHEIISRVLSTQKLVQVTIAGTTNGTFTIDIDGEEIASFAASSSTAAQIRDGLLADFGGDEPVTAEASSTNQLLIEGTDEESDFTIDVASTGTGSDITATTLVAFGQEIPFGVGVVTDPRAAESGKQCRLPRLSTEITAGTFLGISLRDESREYNAGGYADKSAVAIGKRGRFWVSVEGTVVEGAAVYCRYAAGAGGTQLGAFRADGDTSTAAAVPNAKFKTGRTGAGLVQIELL